MVTSPKCPLDGHSPGCLPFLAQSQYPDEGIGACVSGTIPRAQTKASRPTLSGTKEPIEERDRYASPASLRVCIYAGGHPANAYDPITYNELGPEREGSRDGSCCSPSAGRGNPQRASCGTRVRDSRQRR